MDGGFEASDRSKFPSIKRTSSCEFQACFEGPSILTRTATPNVRYVCVCVWAKRTSSIKVFEDLGARASDVTNVSEADVSIHHAHFPLPSITVKVSAFCDLVFGDVARTLDFAVFFKSPETFGKQTPRPPTVRLGLKHEHGGFYKSGGGTPSKADS